MVQTESTSADDGSFPQFEIISYLPEIIKFEITRPITFFVKYSEAHSIRNSCGS